MRVESYKLKVTSTQRGQAALIAVIFFLVISVAVAIGFSAIAIKERSIARGQIKAKKSYFLAEAGAEDASYRVMKAKQLSSSETITLDGESVTTTIVSSSGEKEITAAGDVDNNIRNIRLRLLESSTGVSFFYGVQVGDGGLSMGNGATVTGNVYSNGSIIKTSGSAATITGDATVAGGLPANPTIEWTTQNADQFFATASTNRDIAQSFTATASGALPKVSVYLGKVGNPTSNITLRIATDDSGKPDKSSLTSTTISYSTIGTTPSWIDASFASPPTLTNGTKYWIVLDYSTDSAVNYWNWRKDSTDGYTGNTGKYTDNCCSGNPTWVNVGGDLAFRTWIGSTNTEINGMTIGDSTSGTGHSNLFVNTNIHGSSCPNSYCIVENPPHLDLPISDGVIQDWKNAAEAGGITTGDITVNGAQTIGPRKITGKLTVTNGSTLTVSGTIWVVGDIVFDNGSITRLHTSYGDSSGVVLSDAKINSENGSAFQGSGDPDSYVMILAAKDSIAEEIITAGNTSTGVIYYAGKGRIKFSNNAAAKEATAYGITMDNNAVITYESGLANVNFSSGPSGGWGIAVWREIE